MDKNTEDDVTKVVIYGGIAVGVYFAVVKPLLNAVGANPADTATVAKQSQTTPGANCFSIQFQPFVDNFNNNPSTDADGNVLNMQQYFQAVKAANDSGQPLGGGINIAAIGENLNSDLSAWHLSTDSNQVMGLFSQFDDQTEVASLAAYLYYNYNSDLFTMLQGSLFKADYRQQIWPH